MQRSGDMGIRVRCLVNWLLDISTPFPLLLDHLFLVLLEGVQLKTLTAFINRRRILNRK
ncbi:hypothetical protein BJB45_08250 [Halomonas huangheensis]|uniref:Uncharacterized protein n=1 Tax=Halomonas huangheensis TaxID=1178482 RepID=W1NAI3_9GAMM|nr:hypothetical protein BJB45_08250 [Halomonas huangheensis]